MSFPARSYDAWRNAYPAHWEDPKPVEEQDDDERDIERDARLTREEFIPEYEPEEDFS